MMLSRNTQYYIINFYQSYGFCSAIGKPVEDSKWLTTHWSLDCLKMMLQERQNHSLHVHLMLSPFPVGSPVALLLIAFITPLDTFFINDLICCLYKILINPLFFIINPSICKELSRMCILTLLNTWQLL